MRWLWWTSVLLVIGWAGTRASAALGGGLLLPTAMLWLGAVIVIGTHFRSYWWVLSPPVAIAAFTVAVSLRDPESQIVLGWVIIPLLTFGAFSAVVAGIAVWWGIRDEEHLHF